jgi:hypothetical protein
MTATFKEPEFTSLYFTHRDEKGNERSGAVCVAVATDAQKKEWDACRETIARFDTILADLRKFGFSSSPVSSPGAARARLRRKGYASPSWL